MTSHFIIWNFTVLDVKTRRCNSIKKRCLKLSSSPQEVLPFFLIWPFLLFKRAGKLALKNDDFSTRVCDLSKVCNLECWSLLGSRSHGVLRPRCSFLAWASTFETPWSLGRRREAPWGKIGRDFIKNVVIFFWESKSWCKYMLWDTITVFLKVKTSDTFVWIRGPISDTPDFCSSSHGS